MKDLTLMKSHRTTYTEGRFEIRRLEVVAKLSVLLLIIWVSTACSTNPISNTSETATIDSKIAFIDLDIFNASLSNNMRKRAKKVTVNFPHQPVTINDLPERLQPWLSAVHKHGGGVRVQTEEGYQQKGLMTVLGAVMAGYQLVKQSMPVVLGRNYEAIVVLDNTNGSVSRIDFYRL